MNAVGRKANGPQCYRTPQRKAQDIALSIWCFAAKGVPRRLEDYGIKDEDQTMKQLVYDAIAEIVAKRQAV